MAKMILKLQSFQFFLPLRKVKCNERAFSQSCPKHIIKLFFILPFWFFMDRVNIPATSISTVIEGLFVEVIP